MHLAPGYTVLMAFSPIPGAQEKVSRLRARYARVAESLEGLEAEVEEQQNKLNRLHQENDRGDYRPEYDDPMDVEDSSTAVTAEMLRQEEEEIKMLEQKQAEMERQIKEMEREINMRR